MELTKEHFENHLAEQLNKIQEKMVSKEHFDSKLKSIRKEMVSKKYFDEKFKGVDDKFEKVNSDISAIHSRLEKMDDRMDDLVTTNDLNNALAEQNSEIKKYTDEVSQTVLIGIDNSFSKLKNRVKTIELLK